MAGSKWLAAKGLSCLIAAGLLACGGGDSLSPRIPASIIIVPNAPSIPQKSTRQLTATVVDAAGRAIEGETIGFSSSDTTIVTVSPAGLVTSAGPLGQAEIIANDGELTARITVTVTLPPNAILVTPDPVVLNRTLGIQLVIVVSDANGDPVPFPALTFTSGNPSIVTVGEYGSVQSVGPIGSTTITITSGALSVDVPVTVTQIPARLVLDASSIVLDPGAQHQIVAKLEDQAGQAIPNATVTYSSSNPSVVAVNASGLITTTQSTGSAIVTAASGEFMATMGVFVGTAPPGTIIATVSTGSSAWGVTVTAARRYYVGLLSGTIEGGAFPATGFSTSITGLAEALSIAVNAAGTRGYVARVVPEIGWGIGVLDLTNSTLIDVIPISGPDPLAVALSPDEGTLFVGTGGGLTVVDLPTKTVVAQFPIGAINEITHHPTLPLLYASLGQGSVAEIDATSRTVARVFDFAGIVQGTAVSLDGTELYVTLEGGIGMQVWDLVTNQLKRTISGGSGFGLALSPGGEFLYVARGYDGGEVRIFDRASGALLNTVTTGGVPRRVAFDPATGTAIVTNENGWVDFIK